MRAMPIRLGFPLHECHHISPSPKARRVLASDTTIRIEFPYNDTLFYQMDTTAGLVETRSAIVPETRQYVAMLYSS
jgi:hypothetical protein